MDGYAAGIRMSRIVMIKLALDPIGNGISLSLGRLVLGLGHRHRARAHVLQNLFPLIAMFFNILHRLERIQGQVAAVVAVTVALKAILLKEQRNRRMENGLSAGGGNVSGMRGWTP